MRNNGGRAERSEQGVESGEEEECEKGIIFKFWSRFRAFFEGFVQVEGKAGKGKGKSKTENKKQKGNREDYS
jgi:hypothetical protein